MVRDREVSKPKLKYKHKHKHKHKYSGGGKMVVEDEDRETRRLHMRSKIELHHSVPFQIQTSFILFTVIELSLAWKMSSIPRNDPCSGWD